MADNGVAIASLLSTRLSGLSTFVVDLVDQDGRVFGNNGDRLLERGFSRVMGAAHLTHTSLLREAQALVIPPSGSFRDRYDMMRGTMQRLAREFRGEQIVVMPSSVDMKSELLRDWLPPASRVTFYCREEYSFRHVETRHRRGPWDCFDLRLGHDLAFEADISDARSLEEEEAGGAGVLIAWRRDAESTITGTSGGRPAGLVGDMRSALSPWFPRWARRVRYNLWARRAHQSRLKAAGLDSGTAIRAVKFADISSTTLYEFNEYLELLAWADVVLTDRLHVAVPAARLGKQTHLFEGSYHKILGVYDLSLASFENVTLHRG